MQYRLHIDIPVGTDEKKAIENSQMFIALLLQDRDSIPSSQVNYRLGHDEDRQKSNYLVKNENGHVSNKKTRIDISG
tara:strand:+ start:929 stop:1159 length:231 start_codon:yes stop_codon:yes gene_type:complete